MKKGLLFLISFFMFSTYVFACGEIKSIKVEDAKVLQTGNLSYVVKLNNPKDKVFLEINSDYDFVGAYGSRTVNTNKDALVKVNGYKCGYGIYTYTISFEVSNKTLAENTDTSTNTSESIKGLKNLEIEGYSIEFSNKVYSYSIDVTNDVKSINIIATKNNENDTISISDKANNLQVGKNVILITVIDEKNNTVFYQVTVNKSEKKSENNYLASLKVIGYDINFERDKTEYSLSIPDYVNELELVLIPEDVNAKYDIKGNISLSNGSKVIISVTAENGDKKDYVIKIKKDFNIVNFILNNKIYIIISVLIIILIILIIFTKKNKGKNKVQKPNSIDVPLTTVGEIKSPNIPQQEPVVEAKTDVKPSTLQIIIPTDIEETQLDNTTEVFKL